MPTHFDREQFIRRNLSSISLFLSFFAFRLVLDLSYYTFIGPIYSHTGFVLEPNMVKILESYIILFGIFLLIPKDKSRLSNVIIQIFILMAYIPIQSFYALGDQSRTWFYLTSMFWFITIVFSNLNWRIYFPTPKAKVSLYSNMILYSIILVMMGVCLIILYLGVDINLSLTNVYEIRERYYSANIPYSGYIVNWAGKFILPFLILTSIFGEQRHLSFFPLIISLFFVLVLFSQTGHKTYIFRILMALGVAWLITQSNFLNKVIVILIGVIGGSLLVYHLTNELLFGALFINRVFFIPAKLSFYYYDFFQEGFLYLSNSVLEGYIQYPYEQPPPKIIATKYMNRPEGYSNNGIMSDGYMQFGIVGIIIWGLLFTVLLKIGDAVARGRNKKVIWVMLIISFKTMINGTLFATLLTHGLFLSFVIAYFYPSHQNISLLSKRV